MVDWGRSFAAIIGTSLLFAIAVSLIPDDPYLRFQMLDKSSQRGVRWVYERTQFSDRPIDIAIVGSSRTGAAIDALRLHRSLDQAGCDEAVVNFSLPEEGRDLHWVLAKQILRTKHPKMMILGVIEQPTRVGNPGFKFVAAPRDLVDPAFFGNQNYLTNLIYLPYRSIYLLLGRLAPDSIGLRPVFDSRRAMNGPGLSFNGNGSSMAPAELARRSRIFDRQVKPPILPARYADIEFGNERAYIRRIAGLARTTNTTLVFVYMPHFSGSPQVLQPDFYRSYGPLLAASFLAPHPEYFHNLAHVNAQGTALTTDWLAPQLRPLLAGKSGSDCRSGA